jgi:hypothetical protein
MISTSAAPATNHHLRRLGRRPCCSSAPIGTDSNNAAL